MKGYICNTHKVDLVIDGDKRRIEIRAGSGGGCTLFRGWSEAELDLFVSTGRNPRQGTLHRLDGKTPTLTVHEEIVARAGD